MVVCEVRPQNKDTNCTHVTVTASRICYPVDIGTPTGYLDLVKISINIVLSHRNAQLVRFYEKYFISKTQWTNLSMCA